MMECLISVRVFSIILNTSQESADILTVREYNFEFLAAKIQICSPKSEESSTSSSSCQVSIVISLVSSTQREFYFFSKPYGRREKINIESNADFPTLGAAADTVSG